MGDIFYVSVYLTTLASQADVRLQLFPANDASARHPPLVRVSGRPSNIVQETASFDVDAGQWTSFSNRRDLFPFSGFIPEQWTNKPIPNPNNPKFVAVTGILAGTQLVGTLKRFHVDIVSVTFLGPVPPSQGTYSKSCYLTLTELHHSVNPDREGEVRPELRGQAYPDQENSHLNIQTLGTNPMLLDYPRLFCSHS